MKIKLSKFLMRLALLTLRPAPLSARARMSDEDVAAALCVPPSNPVYRAVLEMMQRHADAERGAAFSTPQSAETSIFYAGRAGNSEDMIAYIEAARLAAMAGRAPEQA